MTVCSVAAEPLDDAAMVINLRCALLGETAASRAKQTEHAQSAIDFELLVLVYYVWSLVPCDCLMQRSLAPASVDASGENDGLCLFRFGELV